MRWLTHFNLEKGAPTDYIFCREASGYPRSRCRSPHNLCCVGFRAFIPWYMHFVFLDEFGHIGPFVSKDHHQYNTSPVFGVAGYYLPEREVRPFASWFYRFKNDIYQKDIEASSRHRATWEKKGNEIFTAGHVYKTKR